LTDEEVRSFLADPVVAKGLDVPADTSKSELVRLAGGAPGKLIAREAWETAMRQARRLLDAAQSPDRGARLRAALGQGASGARGKFADTLDALIVLLHDRAETATHSGKEREAAGAARAIDAIEDAKEQADRNVNPQLVTAGILNRIAPLMR
jgi:hypothetical protein